MLIHARTRSMLSIFLFFQYFAYKPILHRLDCCKPSKSCRSRRKLQDGAIKVVPGTIECSFMPGQGPCYYGTWAAHGPHMDPDDLGVSACGTPGSPWGL